MRYYKKILLTLFLFIIILFMKNNVLAVTLDFSNYSELANFNDIEPLTLQTETDSFLVVINTDTTKIRVIEPYNKEDFLSTRIGSAETSGTYNLVSGYSITSASLTNIITHISNYVDGSWSEWDSGFSVASAFAPGVDGFNFIDKSNILIYASGFGILGNDILSSGVPLPDDIKFTDNIIIFKHTVSADDNSGIYLFHSSNMNDKFRTTNGVDFSCITSTGSEAYFDIYQYSDVTNTFVFKANSYTLNTGVNTSSNYFYSTNDYYNKNNTLLSYASGDFFDFYYEDEEYLFPYIADTDEVLANLDDIEDILIFPR